MRYETAKVEIEIAAKSAIARMGGDFEEMLADANLIFCQSRRGWNRRPTEEQFKRYLRMILKKELTKCRRRERIQRHGLTRSGQPILHQVPLSREIDVPMPPDWTDELSEEALGIAQLALKSKDNMKPREIRQAIRGYLLSIGWTVKEIFRTFTEIGEAIP